MFDFRGDARDACVAHVKHGKLVYSISAGLIYSVAVMTACFQCKETSLVLRIWKCVSCFTSVCERCAVRRYGQKFCSQNCAKSFLLNEDGEFEPEA